MEGQGGEGQTLRQKLWASALMFSTFTAALAAIVVVLFIRHFKRTKKEIAEDVLNVTEYILQGKSLAFPLSQAEKHTQDSKRFVTRSVAAALVILLCSIVYAILHYTYLALALLLLFSLTLIVS